MKKTLASLAGVATLALGMTACADGGSSDQAADGDKITIVASTSVWGDIAKTAAGNSDKVEVINILDSTDDDPHEYEATARDLARIGDADIVVANGGGYDNWLTDHVKNGTPLLTAVPLAEAHHHDHGAEGHEGHTHEGAKAYTRNLAHEGHDHGTESATAPTDMPTEGHADHDHADHDDHAGHDHDAAAAEGDHAGHNHGAAFADDPHVWMDMDKVNDLANRIAAELHSKDETIPAKATDVEKKTQEITDRIGKLEAKNYILTEPVASHLLSDSKLHDVTPSGFAQAIAKESEPSAADIASAQQAITEGKVNLLITNEQSQTPASQELIRAAEQKKVPVVNVNETPTGNDDYFTYIDKFVDDVEHAKS